MVLVPFNEIYLSKFNAILYHNCNRVSKTRLFNCYTITVNNNYYLITTIFIAILKLLKL